MSRSNRRSLFAVAYPERRRPYQLLSTRLGDLKKQKARERFSRGMSKKPTSLEKRVGELNAICLRDHAATVAIPSSRTATLVTPFHAASTATPMGKRPAAGVVISFAVL